MTALSSAFLGAAAVLWLTIFGYVLALWLARPRRPPQASGSGCQPPVAVILPVLNEAALIEARLADLERTEYPAGRLRVLVVDGGSTDETIALVRERIAAGATIEVMTVSPCRGQADQVSAGLARVGEELVVVTDADARLSPDCVPRLVAALCADPRLALVGAEITPASPLPEERIYWWFLNRLWWLEGAVLGNAMVSGVCYALRRSLVLPAVRDAGTADAHLALGAAAIGHRSAHCRSAKATELRVPENARGFLEFRSRRGRGFRAEVLLRRRGAPAAWRLVRAVRLWHLYATPAVAAAAVALGGALSLTPAWRWPLLALAAFALPALAAMLVSRTLAAERPPLWRFGIALARLPLLLWVATLASWRAPATRHAGDNP